MSSSVTQKSELPSWWCFLFFPMMIVIGFTLRNTLGLIWANTFLNYAIIPLLDQTLKQDWSNPTLDQVVRMEKQLRYRVCLYIVLAFEWYIFFVTMTWLPQITIWNVVPILFARANIYAAGFLVSHQLFHKENVVDRWVGTLHLIKSCYLHWMVEHVYGHHKNVSTPLDPASAPKGMTVYEFIPKSVKGGFLSAYEINPRFVTLSIIASLVIVLLIYRFYGMYATLLHVISVIGGIYYLEVINYLEHYGLQRKKLPDGTYERVSIRHSWNAAHVISNFLLFKLQRHSDHHENSLKPYQTLCTYEDSPQLPHGYLTCVLLALFPQTWFGIMDPLVDQYNSTVQAKGTRLAALKVAEDKTKSFVRKFALAIGLILGGQILLRLIH